MFARNQDIKLHYSVTGAGTPVLLITGLGIASSGWWRTVRVMAPRLRVLTFDNRGAGRSDAPPGPYTVAAMARDAVAVLDAARVRRAHVYGLSLGGMVAQELALSYPERVRSLVLGATSAGGRGATPPDDGTLGFLARRAEMPFEQAVWASVPYLYGEATRVRHGGRIGQDIAHRLRWRIDPASYAAQLAAARGHDAAARVAQIAVPTLVVHGEADRMLPADNGRLLAHLIPRAELQLLRGAGHLYETDEPEASRRVLAFLLARSVSRRAGRATGRRAERGARA